MKRPLKQVADVRQNLPRGARRLADAERAEVIRRVGDGDAAAESQRGDDVA
jgi:hypothetical protein